MPEASKAVIADPNVFIAHFLGSCEAGNTPLAARLNLAKESWAIARDFIAWVNAGQDVAMFAERDAQERRIEEKKRSVEAADRAAAEARRAQAREAFGAKVG